MFPGSLVVGVFNKSDISLIQIKGNLGVPIVLCIQGLAIQASLEVISDNVNLLPSSEKCFSGGKVAYVTQTENIFIFSVSQSLNVNIQ